MDASFAWLAIVCWTTDLSFLAAEPVRNYKRREGTGGRGFLFI